MKRSAQDRNSLSSDDLSRGGVVGPGQVEEVRDGGAAGRLEGVVGEALVLLPAHYLALVRDCLDVVLIFVAGLVQGVLAILQPLAKLGLFGMVEPLHLDYHTAGPGLPEALDATYIGEVGTSG